MSPCNNGLLHSKDLISRVLMVAAGGGGDCGPPSLKKIAVNCGEIAVKIAVHFFLVPRLYASHEQQWSTGLFAKSFLDQLCTQLVG